MSKNSAPADFIFGFLGGPLVAWLIFFCGMSLLMALSHMWEMPNYSRRFRIAVSVFAVLKYGFFPLWMIFQFWERPALLAGGATSLSLIYLWMKCGRKNEAKKA
jgi:hypothetical protein